MTTMRFTISIGVLAGSIQTIAAVAARFGVTLSYGKVRGILCRTYSCVALGEPSALRRFRSYLRMIDGEIA